VDRYLKERLVGAAVLVAAAIIFIPEMLSGPHPDSTTGVKSQPDQSAADESAVKTYTIDLTAAKLPVTEQEVPTDKPRQTLPVPQASEPTAAKVSERTGVSAPATGPEAAQIQAEEKAREKSPETSSSGRPALSKEDSEVARTPAQATVEKAAGEKSVGDKAAPQKPIGSVSQSGKGPWVVQVASFGVRSKSDGIAHDLKAKGFSAFVVASTIKGQTMYRVRVGPAGDRAEAESLLKKVKPIHPGAAVVPE
jgi:DedD protein